MTCDGREGRTEDWSKFSESNFRKFDSGKSRQTVYIKLIHIYVSIFRCLASEDRVCGDNVHVQREAGDQDPDPGRTRRHSEEAQSSGWKRLRSIKCWAVAGVSMELQTSLHVPIIEYEVSEN